MDYEEEWTTLEDFPIYEISNYGRVKSKSARKKGALMTPAIGKGYYFYNLRDKNGNPRTIRAHALVCLAFIGPLPKGYCVCHYDGNKKNNYIGNLRYGTYMDNGLDTKRQNGNLEREANETQKRWLWKEIVKKAIEKYKNGQTKYRRGGVSLKDVAEEIGVSISMMSRFVNGSRGAGKRIHKVP